MASRKQTAFILDENRHGEIASNEPQSFGTLPGIWAKGVPVLLSEVDPTLTEKEFRKMVKESGAPIVETSLAADFKHKTGDSQVEMMTKGGDAPHLPSGPPLNEIAGAQTEPYEELPKGALQDIAEARGVETEEDDGKAKTKKELAEEVAAEDEGGGSK